MTPEPVKPASAEEVAAGAEASIAAAAVTLEAVQDAIYEEGELSKDRQQELLREVMECRKKLETLSDSVGLAVKTENPSIQQLLMEVGRIQTEIQSIRTDMSILLSDEATIEEENGEADRQGERSPQSNSPNSERDKSDTAPSVPPIEPVESLKPPESNQSATPAPPPKRKRYVKI